MHANLSLLRCPYCGGRLKQNSSYSLQCSCDVYPVIRNIVYLKKDPTNKCGKAVELLSRHKERQAILLLLDSRRIANYLILLFPRLPLSVIYSILEIFYPSGNHWWRYLKNRNLRVTHIIALSTIGAIRSNNLILDIGCGQGNFLASAERWSKTKSIGMDESFFLLYVARVKVVSPQTILLCADANRGIPVASHQINHAFLNDCFMYLDKDAVLREFSRILTASGDAFITHVHNKHGNNLGQGEGITPLEMHKKTSRRFHLGVLSDIQLIKTLRKKTHILYESFKRSAPKYPSYSYHLLPFHMKEKRISIPRPLIRMLKTLRLDYTEDSTLL